MIPVIYYLPIACAWMGLAVSSPMFAIGFGYFWAQARGLRLRAERAEALVKLVKSERFVGGGS